MPRNPEDRRLEILLSPAQYDALHEFVQYEFLGLDPDLQKPLPNGAMSAAIRWVLESMIPTFGEIEPLVKRGKYQRESKTDAMTEALIEAYEEDEWMTMDGFYPPEDDEFGDDENDEE